MTNFEQNKSVFLSILRETVSRPGLEDLIGWLESSDFFTAPASTRFHSNYLGGLCEHSLHVYDCLKALAARYPQFPYTDETIAIVSLLHDTCKADTYRCGVRNRKDPETGRWEQVPCYEFAEQFSGGHGEKSAFLIQYFMRLTPDEYLAIRWHMGGWDSAVRGGDRSINAAYDKCKLAPMLHLADQEASSFLEHTE